MQTIKKVTKPVFDVESFKEKMSKECWNYIKTVVDIVREPILVLDRTLHVMTANDPFYRMFQVDQGSTEGTLVYNLGNGQWDIPALRKLLESILPKNTFFKDFEVVHEFPFIGHKAMLLNARQIHTNNGDQALLPPIIFLAIEDITSMMAIASTLALHAKDLASKNADHTKALEMQIRSLERQLQDSRRS
jgi:two-component system CheB/CheR fusion protein